MCSEIGLCDFKSHLNASTRRLLWSWRRDTSQRQVAIGDPMVLPGRTENGGWASRHPSTSARPGPAPQHPVVPSPGGERAGAHAGPGSAQGPEPPRGRLPQCKDSRPVPAAASGGAGATHQQFSQPQVLAEGCTGRARNFPG